MDVNDIKLANIPQVQTPVKDAAPEVKQPQTVSDAKAFGPGVSYNGAEVLPLDGKSTSDFLDMTIDRVNERLNGADRQFCYSVHEKTGQYLIRVIDTNTNEVIREIPPEKNLDAVAKMWELAGLFVDKTH
jgi:uncharacterized FlaG/YvyC family protein